MPNEICQTRNDKPCMIYLYVKSKRVELREAENGMVVTVGLGLGAGKMGQC